MGTITWSGSFILPICNICGSVPSVNSGIMSQKPQKIGAIPLALNCICIGLIIDLVPEPSINVENFNGGKAIQSYGSKFLRSNFDLIHFVISDGTPTHSVSDQPFAGIQSTYLAMVIIVSATSLSAGESGIKAKFNITLVCPARIGMTSASVKSNVESTWPIFVNNSWLVSSRLSLGRSEVLCSTSLKCGVGGIGLKINQPKNTPVITKTTAQHPAMRCLKCLCLRSKYKATAASMTATVQSEKDVHPCVTEAAPIRTAANAANMAFAPFIVLVLVPLLDEEFICDFPNICIQKTPTININKIGLVVFHHD